MKYLNKLFIIALAFMIPLSGCNTEELQELNIDKNSSNELDWKFLFTQGTLQTAENRYVNGRVHLTLCGSLIQHTATLSGDGDYGDGDKYLYNLDAQNAYMQRMYTGPLKTLAEVIKQTGPDGLNPTWTNLHHMAQVVYMIPMHIMTDLYGNVPYSEANKGFEGIFFPVYDSQESIYSDMLLKLEAAANSIGNGPDEVGSADILFNGDFAQWKKFTNSLMLRLAMRVSEKNPALGEEFAKKAIAGGVMESNDDSAYLRMADGPDEWLNQNGLSRALIPNDWGADNVLSQTIVDRLKSTGDPRLGIFAVRGPFDGPFLTDAADQKGLPNGYDGLTILDFLGETEPIAADSVFSRINPLLLDRSDPFLLLNYPEVELLLAEAALKGWTTDAEGHYNAGVRGAMQMWSIFDDSFVASDADVDAYLLANPFNDTEEMVGNQMWLATFMNWYEAFSAYRRTGFPQLQEVNYPGNISGGKIFKRLQYYTDEVAGNPNLQSTGTTPDLVTTAVWWDVD